MRWKRPDIQALARHATTNDALRTSVALLANTGVTLGLGFIFWLIAASRYTTDDVGAGAALISLSILLSVISKLGLDTVLPLFRQERAFGTILGRSCALTSIVAVLATAAVLLLHSQVPFLPTIVSIRTVVLLAVTTVSTTTLFVLDSALISLGFAVRVLSKGIFFSISKILLPFIPPFEAEGATFLVWTCSVFFSTLLAAVFVWTALRVSHFPKGNPVPSASRLIRLVGTNYAASSLASAPVFLFPVIVASQGGSEAAAVYYMTWTMVSVLLAVPQNLVPWLLGRTQVYQDAEARAITVSAIVGAPVLLAVAFGGPIILEFLGRDYANRVFFYSMVGVMVPAGAASFVLTKLRALSRQNALVLVSAAYGLTAVGALVALFDSFGLLAAAVGWGMGSMTAIAVGTYLASRPASGETGYALPR